MTTVCFHEGLRYSRLSSAYLSKQKNCKYVPIIFTLSPCSPFYFYFETLLNDSVRIFRSFWLLIFGILSKSYLSQMVELFSVIEISKETERAPTNSVTVHVRDKFQLWLKSKLLTCFSLTQSWVVTAAYSYGNSHDGFVAGNRNMVCSANLDNINLIVIYYFDRSRPNL